MTTTLIATSARRQHRRGFSLVEVLMAIGILGVGMIMAAALFPAAIKENQNSFANSMGSLICENGLAVVTLQAKHDPAAVFVPNYTPVALGDDGRYPSGSTARAMGFAALQRQLGSGQNSYQFYIVSYNKSDAQNSVKWIEIPGDIITDASGSKFVPTDGAKAQYLQRNGLLVFKSADARVNNYYGKIATAGSEAVLDRTLFSTATSVTIAGSAWTLYECDASDNLVADVPNPAMGILAAQTALTPK